MSGGSKGARGAELHRAADPMRDQSYSLFSTTPRATRLPAVPVRRPRLQGRARALAARYGLTVADKPDSQDICFRPERGSCTSLRGESLSGSCLR